MKQATFSEGVAIALISSVSIAAVFTVVSSLFFNTDLVRLLIAGVSLFYISYLFLRSDDRVGRITVVLIWFVISLCSLLFTTSLLLYLSIQLLMVWLLRSLYFYNSIFSAITDLLLTIMSVFVASWVWTISSSIFLTFWCFFLIQALFVFIPKNFIRGQKTESINYSDDDFEHAYHAAEIAVSKLVK